jgi:hypothetical protein
MIAYASPWTREVPAPWRQGVGNQPESSLRGWFLFTVDLQSNPYGTPIPCNINGPVRGFIQLSPQVHRARKLYHHALAMSTKPRKPDITRGLCQECNELADCMDMLLRIIIDHGIEKLLKRELTK